MDLSGLIFVVLAVAWAGYLIPRALRHHDRIASDRPVDSFSDTMRVLERTPATMKALLASPAAATAASPRRPATMISREKSRIAARRRRRVLGLLLFALAAVSVTAGLGYLGWAYAAIPGALVVGWLVLCRLMVRKAVPARRTAPVPAESAADSQPRGGSSPVAPSLEAPSLEARSQVASSLEAPADEEPAPASAEVSEAAALDDPGAGSLWDPLPLTLPTYVDKPAARRTVRAIDLNQTGVVTSGHDAEDSKLAQAKADADQAAADSAAAEARKAAGA